MKTGRILITGTQGFIGSRLLMLLRQLGHTCVATEFDLLDFASTDAALAAGPWDAVLHLAAISHVPTCERDPAEAFRVNLAGTAVLLEAIRRRAPQAWVIFASTAQVYAAPSGSEIHQRVVMDEDRRIAPQNVYARTKWEAELLIAEAARREGLAATVLRLFNHTHKTQSADFFLPHLYQSILAKTGKGQVPVGNLEVWRDIGSLQDLLQAFAALLGRSRAPAGMEVFNVCSGSAKLLSKVARELARRMGAEIDFVTDPERVRPGEPDFIQGSHWRLTEATGWTPKCADEAQLVEAFLAD
jgi:GDP-4-dehydro-6-deoxy-D-mannose reductase